MHQRAHIPCDCSGKITSALQNCYYHYHYNYSTINNFLVLLHIPNRNTTTSSKHTVKLHALHEGHVIGYCGGGQQEVVVVVVVVVTVVQH